MNRLDELAEAVMSAARQMPGRVMTSPDDGWGTIAVTLTEDHRLRVMSITEDDEVLDWVMDARDRRAVAVALAFGAWSATINPGDAAARVLPVSERDDRQEKLVVVAVDRDGRSGAWCAQVLRDGEQPPALSEFKHFTPDDSGLFALMKNMMTTTNPRTEG